MSKGKQQLSKGQRFELVEKKVKQLEMTTRVNQMLLQQIGNSVSPMQSDVTETIGRQRELQYRVLAVQELLNLKLEEIEAKSLELQVRDFDEASDKEDKEKQYEAAEVVGEDSAVIVTSKTPEEDDDKGILRSKLLYSEISLPGLKEVLLGTKVGDIVEADVQGVKHKIEVLGIRKVPAPVAEEESSEEALVPPAQGTETGEQQAENG